MCLVLFWHSSCPNCMFQSLTQPCMCFLGVLFSSWSVYVYEKSCSNHVLWYFILTPSIWQQVPLTPGFISGVDWALSDSVSAHGWTGSLLIFFMGINLTSWCRSSPLGAQEVVYWHGWGDKWVMLPTSHGEFLSPAVSPALSERIASGALSQWY